MFMKATANFIDRKDVTLMAAIATPLCIGPADHGRTMTLEEFLDAEAEEGYRYELARGVLEVTQVPNDLHRQEDDAVEPGVNGA